jgi:ribose 5-phosphate isomerase A
LKQEEMKRLAAEKACEYIEDGMILGLGTGSTVDYALKKIGKMIKEGMRIKGVPTSFRTKKIANEENIPLTSLEENPEIDLTIDGADEVDSELRLIKGGGGALTREKMVAYYSNKVIIIIDETKVVKMLGIDFSLPVEVVKFGWTLTQKKLKEFKCNVELRKIMNNPYITDNSNYILDCEFDRIKDPEQLELDINNIPGVVENGLFIGLVDEVIVGSKQGIKTLS